METKMGSKSIFEFTLVYLLPDEKLVADEHLDALFEAGCDDALLGVGKAGRMALEFAREATDAASAFASAKGNVETAIPGAQLIEVQPDIVGASEIATLAKCSRQNVRKQLEKISTLAAPIYAGSGHTLWHLSLLNHYLAQQTTLAISPQAYEISKVAMSANTAIQKHLLATLPEREAGASA